MQTNGNVRRAYGSGSILRQHGVYYGKWRIGSRQVKRRLGPVRQPGSREGLTKTQAEAQLRRLMGDAVAPPVAARVTVAHAGARLLTHLEAMGRKPSTLRSYRSHLATQINPRLGDQAVSMLSREQVESFVAGCMRDGLAAKTTGHCLGLLHNVCEFAIRQGWASEQNPCKRVDRPRGQESDADIRFLEQVEIEALLRAVPDEDFGRVQRVLYLAATMSGMRQGELLALRWCDVDWSARRIRVRRNLVRGQFGTPKSRRGSRSIPLADRLGGELDRLHQQTAYGADEDLVFANPHTGKPMNGNALLKSYQRALQAAGVRRTRFHDLRHTFGTRMAAAGVPMRTLQEWMGHRDLRTTLIYADYAPGAHEVDLVNGAFAGTNSGTNLSPSPTNSDPLDPTRIG
jgi:integrase